MGLEEDSVALFKDVRHFLACIISEREFERHLTMDMRVFLDCLDGLHLICSARCPWMSSFGVRRFQPAFSSIAWLVRPASFASSKCQAM